MQILMQLPVYTKFFTLPLILLSFNISYCQKNNGFDSIAFEKLPINDTIHFCICTNQFNYDYVKVCINGIIQYEGIVYDSINYNKVPRKKFTGYNSQIYYIFFNVITNIDTLNISYTYIEKNHYSSPKKIKYFTPKVLNFTIIPKINGKYVLLGLFPAKDYYWDEKLKIFIHFDPTGGAIKDGFFFD